MSMAHQSESATDDATDEPSPEYDAATFPLEAGSTPADDLEKRDKKARREKMVVAPVWDNEFGEFTGAVELLSQSGSTYELDVTESDCSCPDNSINQPADGCKHERRVILLMEEGHLPMPPRGRGQPEALDDYYAEFVHGRLENLAATYKALAAERDRATDREAFDEALAEVGVFFGHLADAYDAYDAEVSGLPDRPGLPV